MKRILLLCFMLVPMFISEAWAQDRVVSGTITSSDDGSALPGVNVVLKGTTTGTITDVGGNYKLSVPSAGGTLVFSFIGLATQEVEIGARSVIDVPMDSDVKQLTEVVVTAQGISKEKKALGYSIDVVKKDLLESKTEGDIGRLLKGKAPGVNITQTSGVSGSGTNIIIRGYTSVSGSNQPLFVVDGVPFDGGTNQQENFANGQTESSRFLDLDPNNVESVNVLKGLAATVLYGERGRNGVILITTKAGSGIAPKNGMEVTVNQSYFQTQITGIPDYQDNYGNGFQQLGGFFFSNWGPSFEEKKQPDGNYGLLGHPLNSLPKELKEEMQELMFQHMALYGLTDPAKGYYYRPYKDPIETFFRKGHVHNTSINISGGSENASYNVSYGLMNDVGFTPGNEYTRHNLGFGGTAKLANKMTVGGTFNLSNTNKISPPIAASLGSGSGSSFGSSIFGDVLYTPRSVDLENLPFEAPVTHKTVYYRGSNDIQNPRWTLKNAKTGQQTIRLYGTSYINYPILENLFIRYQLGYDIYNEYNFNGQHKGGVDGLINGFYRTQNKRNQIYTNRVTLTYETDLTSDLRLSAVVGAEARNDIRNQEGAHSTNQVVFGVFKHYNFSDHNTNTLLLEYEERNNQKGVFGSVELGYKNFAFLNFQGRNDWTNTLEKEYNSIFYPSVSLAVDLVSGIDALKSQDVVNFLKLRASYGTSASFPDTYLTRSVLSLDSREFVTTSGQVVTANSVGNRLGNDKLKPSLIGELELGLESQFLEGKFGIDASIYRKNTKDLLIDQDLDFSTGYTVTQVNAGELEAKGLEISYFVNVLKSNTALNWKITGNFDKSISLITSLPEGTDQILVEGYLSLGNYAVSPKHELIQTKYKEYKNGVPFGIMQGSVYSRDDKGNIIVDTDGAGIVDPQIGIIGNPFPDYTTSLTNNFSWKGLSLNVELQFRKGGDIYAQTPASIIGRGLGSDVGFERRQTFIIKGVTKERQPNTKQLTASNYFFDNYLYGADEGKVYDGTSLRLSDISLRYSLPASIIGRTPFGSVSITVQGQNLWYKSFYFPKGTNFDTNVLGTGVGNGQGFEFLNTPSSKRYGASIRLTF